MLDDAAFSGSWPTGLDPATNTTGGGNLTQMSAIYGGLFRLEANADGSNAKVVPYQAASGDYAPDGKSITIKLKPNIKFSDGTPFDADAVVFNIRRDMNADCTCKPTWQLDGTPEQAITAQGSDTVVIKFAQPTATAIAAFVIANVNWIGSPTAIQAMGDQFAIKPVAAGPFTVESDDLSQKLVLKKNPTFFIEGRPYLDTLIVQSIQGDQPAYQALLAGQAQAYEGMTTIPLLEEAKNNSSLVVTQQPATSPYVIQLNTKIPPFNDIHAREAIYYATNVEAIRTGLFKGAYPASQSFTAPGGLFNHSTIPGYRTYDLQKATDIINQYYGGSLNVDLGTLDAYVANQVDTELQTEWAQAGIHAKLHSDQLGALVQNFIGGKWQAMLQTAGAWDPAVGVGVGFRFGTTSPFSGISDTQIDDLLQQAGQISDPARRDALYLQVGQRISDQAYAPFILAFAPASVVTKGVHGPGLDTLIPPVVVNTAILWSDAWMEQS
ncbi:MAG TPA: ABC transporter substrate-binding protein [Micromonosporaceae bacterium]